MAVYESAEELYGCLRALFERVEVENPQAAETMLQSRLWLRFRCNDPTAEVTLDARQRPLQVTFGANSHQPELDVALAADTLHRILLGELTLTKALGSGALKPKGPIWKTKALADLFYHARAVYPQVLGQKGLG